MSNPDTNGSAYARAGVDIDAATDAVGRMKAHIKTTVTPGVLTDVGGFGGMFALSALGTLTDPVLVSSIDGVGTKLKVAFATGRHDTIGKDLVSHCVNDILVQGARPLFFLDYFGTGKLEPGVAADVVKGLADGCRAAGCALIGGETAEMPGLYADGEYDLAGCIVGLVERAKVIDGAGVAPGDVLLGLASEGLHTNGYSLGAAGAAGRRRDDAGRAGRRPGRGDSWGGAFVAAPVLCARRPAAAGLVPGPGQGDGAHHGGRVRGQHPARAAGRRRGPGGPGGVGRAAAVPIDPGGGPRVRGGDVPRVQHGDRVRAGRRGLKRRKRRLRGCAPRARRPAGWARPWRGRACRSRTGDGEESSDALADALGR